MTSQETKPLDADALADKARQGLLHAAASLADKPFEDLPTLDYKAAAAQGKRAVVDLLGSAKRDVLAAALAQAFALDHAVGVEARWLVEHCVTTMTFALPPPGAKRLGSNALAVHLLAVPVLVKPGAEKVGMTQAIEEYLLGSLQRTRLIAPAGAVFTLGEMVDCEQMRGFEAVDAFKLGVQFAHHIGDPSRSEAPSTLRAAPYFWQKGPVRLIVFAVVGPKKDDEALCSPALLLPRDGHSKLHEVEQLWMKIFAEDLSKTLGDHVSVLAPPSPLFCAARLASSVDRRLTLEQLMQVPDVPAGKVADVALTLEQESERPQLVLSFSDAQGERLASCWASVAPFDTVRSVALELEQLVREKGLPAVRPIAGRPAPSTRPMPRKAMD